MKQVPEVRLVMSFDGETPAFAVIKGPNGWFGMPGLRKGQFLTDDDVKDAIPLQPGPSAVVDVRYVAAKGFDDDSLCDVDINGNTAARRVSPFVAGAFIVATAAQKDEPIMVRAVRKKDVPLALKPPASALSLVRDSRTSDG